MSEENKIVDVPVTITDAPQAPVASEPPVVVNDVLVTNNQVPELTEIQQKAITSLLVDANQLIGELTSNPFAVTKVISVFMKKAETLQVDGNKLGGADKKKVVLEAGKQLLASKLSNDSTILELYNALAEPTLEAMIDMSRGVNFATVAMNVISDNEVQVAVGNAARSCLRFC